MFRIRICFPVGKGKWYCFYIPIYVIPIRFPPPIPDPDPGPYKTLIQDATILASIGEAITHIGDEGVRQTFEHSIASSIKAMQAKVGEGITISSSRE